MIIGSPDRGAADPVRTCNLFETLITLPGQLEAVRKGRTDPVRFRIRLNRLSRVLKDPDRIAIFTATELRIMQRYADAIRADWEVNGTSSGGQPVPGGVGTTATARKQLAEMTVKFGCEPPRSGGTASIWSVSENSTNTMSILAILVVSVLVALGVIKLIWGRQEKRRICRIPALMRYGSICTMTTVMNISRSGALVKMPIDGISEEDLKLHLPGDSVQARIVWSNSNFAGLKFEKKLPHKYLDEIIDTAYQPDKLDAPTDAVPSCFEPGCHLTCKTHRMTAQSA